MNARALAQSITVRMTVLFAVASALVLVGFGALVYEQAGEALLARQRQPLVGLAGVVRTMMDDIPSIEYFDQHPNAVSHLLDSHPLMTLRIYGEDGRTLFASSSHIAVPKDVWWRSLAGVEPGETGVGLWQPASQTGYRLAVTRFNSARPEIGRGVIVLALDVSEPLRLMRAFRASLFLAVPAAVLLVAVIGFFIARAGLRPIARVAQSARSVTASHLNERLDMAGVPSELGDLASSFNTMLARLEDSFRRLSDFSADLAHELRTPLTSLLGRTRWVLSKSRSADEYREALELSVGEMERLKALASYMLFLAQADHAPAALTRDNVDLRDEADSLIEFFGIAAEERGIALQAHGRATVCADRALLRQALGNLLSNAIRHSPDGERVDVLLERAEGMVTASVVDRGPGLSAADAARLFDRFYRTESSRARDSGGAGLGLAIARSILKMHGGDVSVQSEPGKSTVFVLRIPERAADHKLVTLA